MLTNSIEREREIRKFHVALAQRRLRNVARKKRAARANFYFAKPIAFLPFSLFSLSSLLKPFIVVIQNFCYHGNVTSHFSSLLDLFTFFFCRFRCRRRLALLSVSVIHGPFNLGKVLNFTSRLEKSESLNSV